MGQVSCFSDFSAELSLKAFSCLPAANFSASQTRLSGERSLEVFRSVLKAHSKNKPKFSKMYFHPTAKPLLSQTIFIRSKHSQKQTFPIQQVPASRSPPQLIKLHKAQLVFIRSAFQIRLVFNLKVLKSHVYNLLVSAGYVC